MARPTIDPPVFDIEDLGCDAKRRIALVDKVSEGIQSLGRHIESFMLDSMTTTRVAPPAAPPEPFTARKLLVTMLEADLDAEVIISDHAPSTNKAGEPVAAFVIDSWRLPGWDIRVACASARGEPPPKPRMIVFPGEQVAIDALNEINKRRE